MKIIVPVKQVGTVADEFELLDDGLAVRPDPVEWDSNEWVTFSLKAALQVRDGVENGEHANNARYETAAGGLLGQLLNGADSRASTVTVIGREAVRPDPAWSYMQFDACVDICTVGIEQAPIIKQLRRRVVEQGDLSANLAPPLTLIRKLGNWFGDNRRHRARWTQELGFDVKDAGKQPVAVLWFVGGYASIDPRSRRVSQALAQLFHLADLHFGILYEGERNCGNDGRRVGEEGLVESLADENNRLLSRCECARIVISDPHSLNTTGLQCRLHPTRVDIGLRPTALSVGGEEL